MPRSSLRQSSGAGITVVGKENVGSDKHTVLDYHAFPQHVPVFYGDVVADQDPRLDEAMLPNVAILADANTFQQVGKCPHACSLTNFFCLHQGRGCTNTFFMIL